MENKIKRIVDKFDYEKATLKDNLFFQYKLDNVYSVEFSWVGTLAHINGHFYTTVKVFQTIDDLVHAKSRIIYYNYLNPSDYKQQIEQFILESYKELERMAGNISVNYDCYRSALKDNEELRMQNQDLKAKLAEEKADHTLTKSRIVFANHILAGNRDEKVLLHDQSDKLQQELEQYKKSNKAWTEKHEKLFIKHQEALEAIRELEGEIDRLNACKRCCR